MATNNQMAVHNGDIVRPRPRVVLWGDMFFFIGDKLTLPRI
jgi:hypothetical protein